MKLFKCAVASLLISQMHLQAEVAPEVEMAENNLSSTTINPIEMSCFHHNDRHHATTFNHLSNFNNFFGAAFLPAGSTVPFNGKAVQSGNVIQSAPDAFTFTSSGDYYINFVASANFPTTGGGVILQLDGSNVPPGSAVNFVDTPLVLQQIVPIIASPLLPATLKVIVTGAGLIFPDGPTATISIIQLSSFEHG